MVGAVLSIVRFPISVWNAVTSACLWVWEAIISLPSNAVAYMVECVSWIPLAISNAVDAITAAVTSMIEAITSTTTPPA